MCSEADMYLYISIYISFVLRDRDGAVMDKQQKNGSKSYLGVGGGRYRAAARAAALQAGASILRRE